MPTPTRAEHFPLFNAVRGLAILMVMTVHAVYQPRVNLGITDPLARFLVHLDIAVPIFFCLSGFLIFRPFVSARVKRGTLPDVREYAVRRVLRIVPAYWVALGVIALWIGLPGVGELQKLPRYLFFFHVYWTDTAIKPYVIGQSWTLDVEVIFYALVPLLSWALLRRGAGLRTELALVAGLALSAWAWIAFSLTQIDRVNMDSLPYLLSFPAHIDHFALGMLLAVLSVRFRSTPPRVLQRFADRGGLCIGVALAFWLLACIVGTDGISFERDPQYFVTHILYGGTAFFFILAGVWGDPSQGIARGRVLRSRVFGWIGTVSLSFYLLHFAVIAQLGEWLTPSRDWSVLAWGGWWVAVAAGSTAVASVSYWLVERPCMNWRRAARPTPATVAAEVPAP